MEASERPFFTAGTDAAKQILQREGSTHMLCAKLCLPWLEGNTGWKRNSERGLGCAVENGEAIRVWQDNWLSIKEQLCPIGPPTLQAQNMRVKELIKAASDEWDVDQIKLHLPQYEDHILKLVPGSLAMEDERVWLLDKTGSYTTKSGYACAKVNSGSSHDTFNWKKCIWNINCSPKLKHFLWKLKIDALAVGESLLKHGMQVDGKCKRCGEIESVIHVMAQCPFAQRVWNLAPVVSSPVASTTLSMGELLSECVKIVSLPPSGLYTPLYPWIFWVMWTSRNQLFFEDESFSKSEVMLKALKAAKEWQAAVQPAKTSPVSPKDFNKLNCNPQVPANTIRIYSDAAWNGSSYAGGLGWVATDPAGITLFEGNSARRVVSSVLTAEALALKAGLTMAVAAGIKDVICFSDSRHLINILTGNKYVIDLKGIFYDLGVLSRSLSSISFCFVSRNCNVQADMLAKNALFLFSNNPLGIANSVA